MKLTVAPETPRHSTDEVRVAVSVAVPPKPADPETLPSVTAAGVTTRLPVPLTAL